MGNRSTKKRNTLTKWIVSIGYQRKFFLFNHHYSSFFFDSSKYKIQKKRLLYRFSTHSVQISTFDHKLLYTRFDHCGMELLDFCCCCSLLLSFSHSTYNYTLNLCIKRKIPTTTLNGIFIRLREGIKKHSPPAKTIDIRPEIFRQKWPNKREQQTHTNKQ